MDKNFLPSLFSDPLTNSLTFPDLVKTLPLLVGGNSKVTNQDLWFFMNTTGNSTYFLGVTRNSICSWKNVMTFYFYPYPLYPFASHLVSTRCKLTPFQMQLVSVLNSLSQKQLSRGVLRKMCMHAANFTYWRTPTPKCNLLNLHFDMGVLL